MGHPARIEGAWLKPCRKCRHCNPASAAEVRFSAQTDVKDPMLFGPLGLIHHGSNIEIKKGQSIKAFVSDDIKLVPVA